MKNLMINVFWDNLLITLNNYLDKFLNFIENSGLNILNAIFLFFVGLFIIRFVIKIIKKILLKTKMEHVIVNYLTSIFKIILTFILLITLLKTLGIDTTSLIAIFTTVSLALSLAMENTFSNLANGFIIIFTKPFKEGDWISIGNFEGSVKDIKLLYTILTTSDNKDINIPNSHFIGNELINYNANPTRKVIMTFDCAYDSDVDKVKGIIRHCIEVNDNALLDPEPVVRLKALLESSLQFQAIIHCKSENYWNLYYELIDSVFNEFKREKISIPFNQLEVRLLPTETQPETYREAQLAERTNDGKFEVKIDNKDMIDKISDSVNIVGYVKNHKKRKSENNTKSKKG